MQPGAAAPLMGGAEGVPFGEFDQAADHRPRAQIGEGRLGAGQQAVEHIDRRLRCDRAHAPRLAEIGDEKRLAAGLGEPDSHLFDAAAIAVGLDHRRAFRGHGAAAERAPIGFDGAKVDGQDAAGFRGRRAGRDDGLVRPLGERRAQVLLGGGFCLGHAA